jgi:hypothetical protein
MNSSCHKASNESDQRGRSRPKDLRLRFSWTTPQETNELVVAPFHDGGVVGQREPMFDLPLGTDDRVVGESQKNQAKQTVAFSSSLSSLPDVNNRPSSDNNDNDIRNYECCRSCLLCVLGTILRYCCCRRHSTRCTTTTIVRTTTTTPLDVGTFSNSSTTTTTTGNYNNDTNINSSAAADDEPETSILLCESKRLQREERLVIRTLLHIAATGMAAQSSSSSSSSPEVLGELSGAGGICVHFASQQYQLMFSTPTKSTVSALVDSREKSCSASPCLPMSPIDCCNERIVVHDVESSNQQRRLSLPLQPHDVLTDNIVSSKEPKVPSLTHTAAPGDHHSLSSSTTSTASSSLDTITACGCCCGLCLEDFQIGQCVAWSPNPLCDHFYHATCILDWMERRANAAFNNGTGCPFCRRDFFWRRTKPTRMHDDDDEQATAVRLKS